MISPIDILEYLSYTCISAAHNDIFIQKLYLIAQKWKRICAEFVCLFVYIYALTLEIQ